MFCEITQPVFEWSGMTGLRSNSQQPWYQVCLPNGNTYTYNVIKYICIHMEIKSRISHK